MAAVIYLFGPMMFARLGGRGDALAEATAYADVYALAVLGVWMTNILASVARGAGEMGTVSLTIFLASLAQIVVGGVLGLGLAGFPRLGMSGVATGQAVSFSAATVFLLWYLASGRASLALHLKGIVLDGALFRDILRVGGLACLSSVLSVATVLVLTHLVAEFGTVALAGYGIGSRLEFLVIPLAFAVGVACVPMVGVAIGASDVRRARKVAWNGGLVAAFMLGAVGLFFAVFPSLWSGLFTSDPAVLESARIYLVWSGPAFAFYGLALSLYFAAQGAGKVFGPVLAGVVRLGVVIAGGVCLARWNAPQWTMFVVVALSMVAYGLSTVAFIWFTPWGKGEVR